MTGVLHCFTDGRNKSYSFKPFSSEINILKDHLGNEPKPKKLGVVATNQDENSVLNLRLAEAGYHHANNDDYFTYYPLHHLNQSHHM